MSQMQPESVSFRTIVLCSKADSLQWVTFPKIVLLVAGTIAETAAKKGI